MPRQHKHERQYTPSTHSVIPRRRIWNDDCDGQMIFGDLGGLKFPGICLTGEENPRKNLTQETCPDRGSNPGPLRDKRACYRLLHSGGLNRVFNVIKSPVTIYNVTILNNGENKRKCKTLLKLTVQFSRFVTNTYRIDYTTICGGHGAASPSYTVKRGNGWNFCHFGQKSLFNFIELILSTHTNP